MCDVSRLLHLPPIERGRKPRRASRTMATATFFIWLDMLDALLLAKARNIAFEQVVFVSNDKKMDWSREGVAHPILSAEMAALVGVAIRDVGRCQAGPAGRGGKRIARIPGLLDIS